MIFVQLDRTFTEFTKTETDDSYIERFGYSSYLHKPQTWSELLKNRHLVILGEAGIGKTREFIEQDRIVNHSGKFAFFIDVSSLIDEGLEQILVPLAFKRFQTWLSSEDEAIFFLDSIDEGRLYNPKAFESALRKLRKSINNKWNKARLVISCRVSEWQYISDLNILENALGIKNNFSNTNDTNEAFREDKSEIKVVQLNPLNIEQITKLASAWGISDIKKFKKDIVSANAEIFLGRPRDVEWIVQYWKERKSLGTLTELIEYNISHKLSEHNTIHKKKDFSLSMEKARVGIELLAAAVAFCKKPSIYLPDPEINPASKQTVIDPRIVLQNWTDQEIQTLLNRAIFDEGIYGRVRFHHRSVTEYLAAQWIVKLRNAGCGINKIEKIILNTIYDRTMVIPSRSAVASWVAGSISEILEKIKKVEPEVILFDGDPGKIPVEDREFALRQLAEKYKNREHLGWWLDRVQLRRIASPDLATTIKSLLYEYRNTVDVRQMLLEIIEAGKLSECADISLSIALNKSEDEHVRICALRALKAINQAVCLKQFTEYVKKVAVFSNNLIGVICECLFPQYFTVNDCLYLLSSAETEIRNRRTLLRYVFEDNLPTACSFEHLVELVKGLLYLAMTPPLIEANGVKVLSDHFWWLPNVIDKLLVIIIQKNSRKTLPLTLIKETYAFLLKCHEIRDVDISIQVITDELQKHPWLRRELYWDFVKQHRKPVENRFLYMRNFFDLCPLLEEDIEWLIEDVKSAHSIYDRKQALDTIFFNFHFDIPTKKRDVIIEAVKGNKELHKYAKKNLYPKPSNRVQQWEKRQKEKKEKQKEQQRQEKKRWRERLLTDLHDIYSGKHFSHLYSLLDFARRCCPDHHNRLGVDVWRALIPEFGNKVAEATREGSKIWWRSWMPPLPHEVEDKSKIENGVILGLSGLMIDANDGLNFSELSSKEATIAAHYAMREMNVFPEWLPKLIKANPAIVREISLKVFIEELSPSTDDKQSSRIIDYVRYSGQQVIDFCTPIFIELLNIICPLKPEILHSILINILCSAKIDKKKINNIAENHALLLAKHNRPELCLHWLMFWLHVDAKHAWNFIERFINDQCNAIFDSIESFVISLAAIMKKSFRTESIKLLAEFEKPEILGRMIPVLLKYIRPGEDVWHEKVYSPGERDNAQDFRDQLPQKLSNIPGSEAYFTLLKLAEDKNLKKQRDWFLRLADEHVEKFSEPQPWEPKHIFQFSTLYEKEPLKASELFDIANDRLYDLRAHIETGDFSERDLFKENMQEEEIQKWFAARLREQGKGMYTVHREEEVDLKKKPDIRLHHSNAGIVGIEIKPTDRYSYNELKNALEVQLIGQYLKSVEAQYGMMLLIKLNDKEYNPMDGRGRLDFQQIIDELNREAKRLTMGNCEIEQVKVIGIDFT